MMTSNSSSPRSSSEGSQLNPPIKNDLMRPNSIVRQGSSSSLMSQGKTRVEKMADFIKNSKAVPRASEGRRPASASPKKSRKVDQRALARSPSVDGSYYNKFERLERDWKDSIDKYRESPTPRTPSKPTPRTPTKPQPLTPNKTKQTEKAASPTDKKKLTQREEDYLRLKTGVGLKADNFFEVAMKFDNQSGSNKEKRSPTASKLKALNPSNKISNTKTANIEKTKRKQTPKSVDRSSVGTVSRSNSRRRMRSRSPRGRRHKRKRKSRARSPKRRFARRSHDRSHSKSSVSTINTSRCSSRLSKGRARKSRSRTRRRHRTISVQTHSLQNSPYRDALSPSPSIFSRSSSFKGGVMKRPKGKLSEGEKSKLHTNKSTPTDDEPNKYEKLKRRQQSKAVDNSSEKENRSICSKRVNHDHKLSMNKKRVSRSKKYVYPQRDKLIVIPSSTPVTYQNNDRKAKLSEKKTKRNVV